ncbi:MAG: type IV pilus twitching motility protein PilT [Vulcanimicrobiaceae bacterium]
MKPMLADIEEAIRIARESAVAASTSDLHIEGNEPPWQRVDGAMERMELPVIEPESVRAFCETYLSKREIERLTGALGAADGAIVHPSFGGIRIHAFRGENGLALSLRLLREGVPDLATLGLPEVVASFADYATGLVLFTGPTGSGKSTALAGLLDQINRRYRRNVVTVEDPIEYRHRSKKSLIRQREVGRDVCSYGESLRGVLRADPDVILIGELRDPDVMTACLSASETGHLVFSTLHTSEASETVQRIVGVFDGGRQEQARMQLAQSLQAIVSMRLVPDASGRGRHPACEVLVNTPAVRAQLMSPEKTIQIRNTIETSRRDGMQTLEMDLSRLVNAGMITYEAAVAASDYPEQIRVAAGVR